MVEKTKGFGWKSRFRRFSAGAELKKNFLILCLILLMAGCVKARTPEQMAVERETIAKANIQEMRDSVATVNFQQPLTLADCINIGLKNNLAIRVAEFDRAITSKETLTQKLRMLPGLTAQAGYERKDKLRKSKVYNWQTDQDIDDFTVSELKDGAKASLSLTWNVLDTILAYVRSGASEMKEQVLEKRQHRQSQFLALDITEAYWQAAAVEDALDYVHEVEKKLRAVKKDIDESVKLRALDVMDATEAEMRLKELEVTIRRLQADLSKARLNLAQFMGLNQNIQFTLYRPPIKPIIGALPHPKELDIDRLEEYALTNRPDLFESDINVDIQKQEAKSAFLRLFPGVNLFATTHYDDNRLLLSNTWNSVGAGLGWNLLDLPAQIANLQARKIGITMAEVQRLMLTVGVITEVHIALLDYAIKADRFRLLEDTYTLSANLLDMAREKKEFGKLPALAVTQRHLEEMASKLRRDEAVVDLLVAHKRLCVTVGINPLDCDASFMGGRSGALAETMPIKRWRCTECGYIHTGPRPPEFCPICGATRGQFKEYSGEDDLQGLSEWGKSKEPVMKDENLSSAGSGYSSSAASSTPSDRFAASASDRFLWKVQVGAFSKQGGANRMVSQIHQGDLRLLDNRDADVESKQLPSLGLVNRVRFKGLTQADARNLASQLRAKGMEYWLIPPNSAHW